MENALRAVSIITCFNLALACTLGKFENISQENTIKIALFPYTTWFAYF